MKLVTPPHSRCIPLTIHSVVWALLLLSVPAVVAQPDTNSVVVPIGGNSWMTPSGSERIRPDGLSNWLHPNTWLQTYVWVTSPGKLRVAIGGTVAEGTSMLRMSVLGQGKTLTIRSGDVPEALAGEWDIPQAGYVLIELEGLTKTGREFANIHHLRLSGSAIQQGVNFVRNNEGNYFYWGRRGPSVHLNYPLPAGKAVEWFYNELTIPESQDVIGSYFMANGFAEGYFGIQVNSATERRILFSVWSPFKTDDPKSIPDDKKIVMLKKGEGVYTGEFGNEGAGGQSFLRYNWKAGNTYKFLLRGQPTDNNSTIYTAYFFAPELGKWQVIASFKRPVTATNLTRLHSFLENFIPDTGNRSRLARYSNQWVRDTDGVWHELTQARFTGDATAQKGYRLDYAGGVANGAFFLKNCGFFNESTPLKTEFSRPATGRAPVIDFKALP